MSGDLLFWFLFVCRVLLGRCIVISFYRDRWSLCWSIVLCLPGLHWSHVIWECGGLFHTLPHRKFRYGSCTLCWQ